jgi:drug/metabolite transporter (DMT)-like permease
MALLRLLDQPRPRRADLVPLAMVAAGVVIGFPLLTALALREVTSAHAMVFLGLLPLTTATFAVACGAKRPRPAFWAFALGGSALVGGYAIWQGGAEGSLRGDLLLLAAILACGLGYAEGAALSSRLGGWQVISWALLLFLPVTLPMALLRALAGCRVSAGQHWQGSPTSRCSARSWASSSGTEGWRWAAWWR